jgi:hypothetical protein
VIQSAASTQLTPDLRRLQYADLRRSATQSARISGSFFLCDCKSQTEALPILSMTIAPSPFLLYRTTQ